MDALRKWGLNRQLYILIEECSEVQKECTKILRNDELKEDFRIDLLTEIVDLKIMLEKFEVYLNPKGVYDKMLKKHFEDKLKLIQNKIKNE